MKEGSDEMMLTGNDGVVLPPLKAIRAKCLECCCDQVVEVRLCDMTDCPLWPFRMGRNPYRKKRTLTDEQKARLIGQLNKARMENF